MRLKSYYELRHLFHSAGISRCRNIIPTPTRDITAQQKIFLTSSLTLNEYSTCFFASSTTSIFDIRMLFLIMSGKRSWAVVLYERYPSPKVYRGNIFHKLPSPKWGETGGDGCFVFADQLGGYTESLARRTGSEKPWISFYWCGNTQIFRKRSILVIWLAPERACNADTCTRCPHLVFLSGMLSESIIGATTTEFPNYPFLPRYTFGEAYLGLMDNCMNRAAFYRRKRLKLIRKSNTNSGKTTKHHKYWLSGNDTCFVLELNRKSRSRVAENPSKPRCTASTPSVIGIYLQSRWRQRQKHFPRIQSVFKPSWRREIRFLTSNRN